MSIVVMGAVFVDIKGYPLSSYIPGGRNAGRVVQVHGGVSRNIVEDIANVELRPTFVSLVDNTSAGADIVKKLQSHKVDTRYIRTTPDGMGMWLAIFDNTGDVTASISKRPDLGLSSAFSTSRATKFSRRPTAFCSRSTWKRTSSSARSRWRKSTVSPSTRSCPT